jgi:hypothetical protein
MTHIIMADYDSIAIHNEFELDSRHFQGIRLPVALALFAVDPNFVQFATNPNFTSDVPFSDLNQL